MSEQQHSQLCFCGRNKASFYCEDCGRSSCSACLQEEKAYFHICQDCESKNIEGTGSKKKCKDCGKENIIKISQHLKSCPKCHSTNVVNTYEKKEQ